MDFSFSKEQELLRKTAALFAENELEPMAQEIDKSSVFPMENFKKMAECGFTGLGIAAEYGGSGGGSVDEVIVVEEFAKKCMASAATLSIHLITPHIIAALGTEEQKKKYLPRLTKGGEVAAFALTEPGAGSDASAVQTRAVYDEKTNEYVINGTKCFITGGSRASVICVFASTDPSKGTRGLTAFLVENTMSGFSFGKIEDKMGLRGSETAELIFEDLRVPAENIVGKIGEGFRIAMQALDGARIGTGAQGVGVAEGAIDLSVKYMNERVQFGQPIKSNQGLRWYISEMATETEAAKWLVYRAAALKDAGLPVTKEAAMCKLKASENARFVTNLALQIHGGYGYMRDYPLERMYRDAKLTEIYEGTSEIHKIVISRAVLGR